MKIVYLLQDNAVDDAGCRKLVTVINKDQVCSESSKVY